MAAYFMPQFVAYGGHLLVGDFNGHLAVKFRRGDVMEGERYHTCLTLMGGYT